MKDAAKCLLKKLQSKLKSAENNLKNLNAEFEKTTWKLKDITNDICDL